LPTTSGTHFFYEFLNTKIKYFLRLWTNALIISCENIKFLQPKTKSSIPIEITIYWNSQVIHNRNESTKHTKSHKFQKWRFLWEKIQNYKSLQLFQYISHEITNHLCSSTWECALVSIWCLWSANDSLKFRLSAESENPHIGPEIILLKTGVHSAFETCSSNQEQSLTHLPLGNSARGKAIVSHLRRKTWRAQAPSWQQGAICCWRNENAFSWKRVDVLRGARDERRERASSLVSKLIIILRPWWMRLSVLWTYYRYELHAQAAAGIINNACAALTLASHAEIYMCFQERIVLARLLICRPDA